MCAALAEAGVLCPTDAAAKIHTKIQPFIACCRSGESLALASQVHRRCSGLPDESLCVVAGLSGVMVTVL